METFSNGKARSMNCSLCDCAMFPAETGEPWLAFNNKSICFNCYIDLIEEIYKMAGYGDGGIIHLLFSDCLFSSHNRKIRKPIRQYQKILNQLLKKYNFRCVDCGTSKNLTIDHVRPISKGGTDKFKNLQILCKSCNSKKGAKWNGKAKEQNSQ